MTKIAPEFVRYKTSRNICLASFITGFLHCFTNETQLCGRQEPDLVHLLMKSLTGVEHIGVIPGISTHARQAIFGLLASLHDKRLLFRLIHFTYTAPALFPISLSGILSFRIPEFWQIFPSVFHRNPPSFVVKIVSRGFPGSAPAVPRVIFKELLLRFVQINFCGISSRIFPDISTRVSRVFFYSFRCLSSDFSRRSPRISPRIVAALIPGPLIELLC